MKRAEFYINVYQRGNIIDYPKVNGWIEEIKDSKGNKITVGYDKVGQSWRATELMAGLKCNILVSYRTKAECVENIHQNIDIIVEKMKAILKDADYTTKYIKPFRDFVKNI